MVSGSAQRGYRWTGRPCARARQAFLWRLPFVSVVVATRDRPQSIAACLRSLGALEYPRFEVIVVDNVPTSGGRASWCSKPPPVLGLGPRWCATPGRTAPALVARNRGWTWLASWWPSPTTTCSSIRAG